jgi:hypothetical protein
VHKYIFIAFLKACYFIKTNRWKKMNSTAKPRTALSSPEQNASVQNSPEEPSPEQITPVQNSLGQISPEQPAHPVQSIMEEKQTNRSEAAGIKVALKQNEEIAQMAKLCHLFYKMHLPLEFPAMFWPCDHCGKEGHSYCVCDKRRSVNVFICL